MTTNLRPLRYMPLEPLQYRTPEPGEPAELQKALRQAKAQQRTRQQDQASNEANHAAALARLTALKAERDTHGAAMENASDQVANGQATVEEVALKQARLLVVKEATPKLFAIEQDLSRAARGSASLVSESRREIRAIEADLILLEIQEGLAPLSKTIARYFETVADAALVLTPPAD